MQVALNIYRVLPGSREIDASRWFYGSTGAPRVRLDLYEFTKRTTRLSFHVERTFSVTGCAYPPVSEWLLKIIMRARS